MFVRDELLKKLSINISARTNVHAYLETREGFCFLCRTGNQEDRSFFTVLTWKEFAKVYQLEVGMENFLRLGGKPKRHLLVCLGTDPITHPRKYPHKYRAILTNTISYGYYNKSYLQIFSYLITKWML